MLPHKCDFCDNPANYEIETLPTAETPSVTIYICAACADEQLTPYEPTEQEKRESEGGGE